YLDNQYITEFDANQTIYESLTKSKFLATITSYFNSFTSFKCIFRLKATEEDPPLAELIEKVQVFDQLAVNKELSKPQRFINISDKKILLGKLIVGKPKYITDLENEDTFYVICGTVDNKESKFSKNNAEMLVVKFELSDFSGSMRIIYFAKTEKKQRKLLALSNGDEVLVYGKLVNNKFSNQTELIAYDINRCKIVAEEQQLNCKLVPEKYLVVFPQRVSKVLQKSFVAQDITEKKIENEFLLSNSVVVFDIETTGLNHLQEKIIEIGAVKLVKGIVTETFSTLVNPEIHISDKIQELTHITDYMVINAPTISEVMGDFYKFCSDSSVTGYNVVDFDMK
ncbi:MAG: exonuclease domain-containing protein, partial [Clostridia bacterium]